MTKHSFPSTQVIWRLILDEGVFRFKGLPGNACRRCPFHRPAQGKEKRIGDDGSEKYFMEIFHTTGAAAGIYPLASVADPVNLNGKP